MQRNLYDPQPLNSSFLSCEKDTAIILDKLFRSCQHSEDLVKLLVIQNKDALDGNYDIKKYDVKYLIDNDYINMKPIIKLPEHDQVKSFLSIHFDNFTPNTTNPEYRDCMIHFDVVCHHDHWDLGNFRQRPFKILGVIDGILNKSRLTGIGKIHFVGCSKVLLNEDWSAFALSYMAIHGSDDKIPLKDEE